MYFLFVDEHIGGQAALNWISGIVQDANPLPCFLLARGVHNGVLDSHVTQTLGGLPGAPGATGAYRAVGFRAA